MRERHSARRFPPRRSLAPGRTSRRSNTDKWPWRSQRPAWPARDSTREGKGREGKGIGGQQRRGVSPRLPCLPLDASNRLESGSCWRGGQGSEQQVWPVTLYQSLAAPPTASPNGRTTGRGNAHSPTSATCQCQCQQPKAANPRRFGYRRATKAPASHLNAEAGPAVGEVAVPAAAVVSHYASTQMLGCRNLLAHNLAFSRTPMAYTFPRSPGRFASSWERAPSRASILRSFAVFESRHEWTSASFGK